MQLFDPEIRGYNDVFAISINGTNCALVPGTNLPVSVDRINGGNPFGAANASRPELFRNNARDSGARLNTEMDGLTTVLTCSAAVTPGATNHARLAIADAGDAIFDAAVLLEGRSGTSGVLHGGDGSKSGSKNQCHKTKDPVNCATGNFWHTFNDLTVPGAVRRSTSTAPTTPRMPAMPAPSGPAGPPRTRCRSPATPRAILRRPRSPVRSAPSPRRVSSTPDPASSTATATTRRWAPARPST